MKCEATEKTKELILQTLLCIVLLANKSNQIN